MNILLPVGKVSKLFGLNGGVLVNLYDTFPDNINNEEPLFVKIDMLAVPLFTDSFNRRGKRGALVQFADIDNPARAQELIGREIFMRCEGGHDHSDTGLPSARQIGPRDRRSGRGFQPGDPSRGREEDDREEGELFFDELVGYTAVISEHGAAALRGTVTAFIDSAMNPLLQIEAEGKEILIPAAEEFIESLDAERREILLNIPEGLLDLNL